MSVEHNPLSSAIAATAVVVNETRKLTSFHLPIRQNKTN